MAVLLVRPVPRRGFFRPRRGPETPLPWRRNIVVDTFPTWHLFLWSRLFKVTKAVVTAAQALRVHPASKWPSPAPDSRCFLNAGHFLNASFLENVAFTSKIYRQAGRRNRLLSFADEITERRPWWNFLATTLVADFAWRNPIVPCRALPTKM